MVFTKAQKEVILTHFLENVLDLEPNSPLQKALFRHGFRLPEDIADCPIELFESLDYNALPEDAPAGTPSNIVPLEGCYADQLVVAWAFIRDKQLCASSYNLEDDE